MGANVASGSSIRPVQGEAVTPIEHAAFEKRARRGSLRTGRSVADILGDLIAEHEGRLAGAEFRWNELGPGRATEQERQRINFRRLLPLLALIGGPR